MRCLLISLMIPLAYCVFSLPAFAQQVISPQRAIELANEADLEARTKALRDLQEKPRPQRAASTHFKLDKKDRERIAELRRVNPKDLDYYSSLLKVKNTGIFKIFPFIDCISKGVIRVDAECAAFVPDTSDYSFLQRDYVWEIFHDIGFRKGEIVSRGFFSQGVFVPLGNVPIEDVKLDQAEIKFLSQFRPSPSFNDAKSMAKMFDEGIYDDGKRYASQVKVEENTTYGFRLIAYKTRNGTAPDSNAVNDPMSPSMMFGYLDLVKRADVTLVFRVVRRDEDGSLTIIWKELDRHEAPKILFEKGEKRADFRQ